MCFRLLYCTFYTCTLHSFFVCASYILMHLFSILFVFCASFLCLFLIAFSLIYKFSFFLFLCIFKSSFLNSLYIFIVFLGLLLALYIFNNFFISSSVFIFSVPGYTSITKKLFTCFWFKRSRGYFYLVLREYFSWYRFIFFPDFPFSAWFDL